jgi:uncharacterized phage infection (PIP) family protein YhgE
MKRKSLWLTSLCAAVLIVAACANLKEPARQAVASAESSLAAMRDEGAKYAPDALAAVEAQLASLKESFAKGDYKAVMAGAPKVTAAIAGLKDTITAKKAEMEAALASQCSSLSADLPKMIEAIQSRVDTLSKSRRLPKNLDKATFESAKSGLDSLKATWAEATAASSSGNVADAVAKAQAAKDKGTDIMSQLGMKPAS